MNEYRIPRELVNRFIAGTACSIVAAFVYMYLWNGDDRAFKAQVLYQLKTLDHSLQKLEERSHVHQ